MEGRRVGDVGSELSRERAYTRLRPGPGQKVDHVASHQRFRLLQAMLDLVADEGYDSITVRKLSQLAGVSTASFYARFDGKEECFLATCSLVLDRIHHRVSAARTHHEDERIQLTHTVEAFLAEPTADPDAARVALVDAFGGGPAALGRMRAFETSLEVEIGNNLSRRGASPSPAVVSWITAGCIRACRSLLTKGGDEGRDLTKRLAAWGSACLDSALEQTPPVVTSGNNKLVERDGPPDPRSFEERDTILTAVTKLATSRGYWGLRVSDIRRQAGVSRAAFDAHFKGVEDCYLAAAVELARSYLSGVVAVAGVRSDQRERQVHKAAIALTQRLAAEPKKARLAFVGILDPGTEGFEQRERLIGELAVAWQEPGVQDEAPSQFYAETTIGAFWNAIARQLDAQATTSFVAEASTFASLLMAPNRSLAPLSPCSRRDSIAISGSDEPPMHRS